MKSILELPTEKDYYSKVLDFIDKQLEECGCTIKKQLQIEIAVEEIFVNIASYAYYHENGMVKIEFSFEGDRAEITFIDNGIPYNPLLKEDPDITLSAQERQIGGLGIYVVKKTMDEVNYRNENGCNILTIVKQIK